MGLRDSPVITTDKTLIFAKTFLGGSRVNFLSAYIARAMRLFQRDWLLAEKERLPHIGGLLVFSSAFRRKCRLYLLHIRPLSGLCVKCGGRAFGRRI
jgi:hypothetical protein